MSGFLWSLTNGDLDQVKDFVENQVRLVDILFSIIKENYSIIWICLVFSLFGSLRY